MSRKFAAAGAIIGLSVNVLLASPSPINPAAEYELLHAAIGGALIFDSQDTINRLRGRKRRTPSDFVRQFEMNDALQTTFEFHS